MHLRPELVLLQKTMVQVEGVARGLDPKHDMWAAARPIVERWVQRELGAEAVAKRAIDEAALGFAALRRLPHTLLAVEAAARKVSGEAPREERKWYQLPTFWLGIMAGAVLALVLTAGGQKPAPAPAPIEEPPPVIERAPLKPQVQPADPASDAPVA